MDTDLLMSRLIALGLAYALAFPIGWDRERHARSAGLRTFPLVALATCAFVQATLPIVADEPEALARIIEGVIVGMGFIGGGAILKRGTMVTGTATAASLWATGAIGLSVALEAYDVAAIVCALTFVTLKVLPLLKKNGRDDDVQSKERPPE